MDLEFFASHLYISVAIKARVLQFNMFIMHKNTISKMFLVFF